MGGDTAIPLRRFEGPLKRHRVDENESLASLILDLAFPAFRGRDSSDARRNRIHNLFYGPDGRNQLPTASPRRRFSGDSFAEERLPRGRYFSLARPYPPGYSGDPALKVNDNGVVRNELVAYANYRAAGPLLVLDVHDRTDRHMLQRLGLLSDNEPQRPAFRTVFYRMKGVASLFDVIFGERQNDGEFDWDDYGGAVTYTVVGPSLPIPGVEMRDAYIEMAQSFDLYYGFEDASLDNVVDLRYPDTQEAFVRHFCPKLLSTHKNVGAVGGFLEMLPALLSPELGGTANTDMIGAYLRSTGAQALIYPSARCNAEVEIRDGQLVGFHGWNLVDYRGAAVDWAPRLANFTPAGEDNGIRVEAPPASAREYSGSWRVRGAPERAARRLETEVRGYSNDHRPASSTDSL